MLFIFLVLNMSSEEKNKIIFLMNKKNKIDKLKQRINITRLSFSIIVFNIL